VRDNKFVTRLASGTLVSAVAGAVLLAGGVANAAPLPTSVGITTVQAADPVTTTTALAVTPASPVDDATTTETLTATLDPATAAGAVVFNDGSNPLGAAVTVANGTASTTATLPTGEHSLTAVFTPTDTTTSGSTSNTVDYTVNGNRGDRHATRNIRGILGHDRGVLGGHRNNRTNVNNNRGNVGNLGNLGGIQGLLGGIQGVLGDLGGNVSN
jgi:hypothetical protein